MVGIRVTVSVMFMAMVIKLPLMTARAALCNGAVHLVVCLCTKNAIFSKTKQCTAMDSYH